MIKDLNLSGLLPSVIDIARQASVEIMRIYATDFDVEKKHDRSPLTEADMAAHHTICDGLVSLTPDIPVLSEESADVSFEMRQNWSRYWLVDPLDGTREFVKKNGEFTVNIALIHEHRSVLGVVFAPARQSCYYAAAGSGAFRQEAGKEVEKINTRRTSLEKIIVAGSRSHATEKQTALIQAIGGNVELISVGSSLKFCLVAEGTADIYPRFGPTSEWDTAAAQCIVEEAGGMVMDTAFEPLSYNIKESLLNPSFLVIGDMDFNWQPYLDKI